MKQKNIALCPTLAAGDAIEQYNGWHKGIDAEPERIQTKTHKFPGGFKGRGNYLYGRRCRRFPTWR